MSRIYQGGQSQNSYQARNRSVGYNPTQALSDQQAIIQEGERALRDLKTKERETQRQNQTADLERQSQDRADTSTLKMEQMRANNLLKQQQSVEKAAAETAELAAQADLKMSQTTESGKVSIEQLSDKSVLKLNQLRETNAQKLEQMEEKNLLKSEHSATRADNQLSMQHLQLSQQVERANTQVAFTAIKGLIDFGSSYAKAAIEYKAQQTEMDGFDDLFGGGPINADGTVSPAVSNEAGIRSVEIAEEQAIQQVAPGDTVGQEALRQPGADQSMMRAQSQAYVAGSALDLSSRLSDLIESNPTVLNGQGQQVPLKSLRTTGEYSNGVKQLVRGLYQADGISKGDSYAAYMTYGKAARAAYNQQVQDGGSKLIARNKQERYDVGLSAGTAIAANGQAQAGWNTSITQAVGSGNFDSKSMREINTAVLKDHISRLPKEKIKDLLNVRKIGSQAGTEFGNSPEYKKIIMDAYNSRIQDENSYFTTQEKANAIEVQRVTQEVNMALMADGLEGEQSLQIRQDAIARLQEIGTPQALDAAQTLREKGGNNQSVYLGFVEGFEGGDPPSSEELADARADDSISHEQLQELKQMGLRSDQITQAMEKAGLPSIDKQLKNAISMRLASADVDSTERAGLSERLSAYLLPAAKTQFNNFLNQQPTPSSLQIQQEAARIIDGLGAQVYDPKNIDGSLIIKGGANGTGIATLNLDQKYATTRRNPTTGLYQKNYIQVDVRDIPRNASVNDAYLNRDTFLETVDLWDRGRPTSEYPKRVRDVAAQLNVSPLQFIRSQAQALGYPSIEKVSPAIQANPPTNMKSGFNALQSMGFPTRGAAYLAGNIMQESSWNGQRDWGEVANDGSDRNGGLVSWMDGVAHNNFRLTKIENYLGKGIASASPSEQLQAMQWEMKQDYKNAYRIFMNPNATDVQLRRASREYWGYGHEGERYAYAKSLLP